MTKASYIMGRTERERSRLRVQGSILNPLTERFLLQAGIREGMRILDVGCGIGDVALIAARIAGQGGEVTGIDPDGQSIAVAQQRAACARFNVRFECIALADYRPAGCFDAIVSRHVLLHSADPLVMLRKAVSLLGEGGLAAFQEYDLCSWPPGYPDVSLSANLQWALVEVFRSATPHVNIGMRLPRLLQDAGFGAVRSMAECMIDSGPDSPFYDWFAETVRSVLPAMNKLGLAAIAGDIDTLSERIRDEIVEAGSCIASPLIVGAVGVKGARSN